MKAAANFKIEGEIPISSDLKYKFWAKGIDGYDLPEAEVSLAQATAYPVNSTTEAFDSIKFYADDKIFKFEWFMQRAKEGSLEVKITETKNDMYVIKTDPATPLRQETLYHIACKHLHGNKGTNEQEMVDRIYSEFQTVAVKNRAGDPLYYYKDKDTEYVTTTDLLKHKDSQCGAWASLFYNAIKLQKVSGVKFSEIGANIGDEMMCIKNYKTKNNVPFDSAQYKYKFAYTEKEYIAEKNIAIICDDDGVSGQNNANPNSLFYLHYIIEYNNKIYDPSYGKKYNSLIVWEENSIWGYAFWEKDIIRARVKNNQDEPLVARINTSAKISIVVKKFAKDFNIR